MGDDRRAKKMFPSPARISTDADPDSFSRGIWTKHRRLRRVVSSRMRARSLEAALRNARHVRCGETGRGHATRSLTAANARTDHANMTSSSKHVRARSDRITRNTTFARCIGCGKRLEIDWVKQKFDADGGVAPSCPACEDPIKTATISFGEAMPELQMQRATELAQECDLMLAIGSSLVVWPAAGFPMLAKRCGAKLVIIKFKRPIKRSGDGMRSISAKRLVRS